MSRLNDRFKRGEPFRDARRLLIACEGEKDEFEYFRYLRTKHRRSSIIIKFLERVSDSTSHGSPDQVIKSIRHYVASEEFVEGDELWAVIDEDRWRDKIPLAESVCHSESWNISVNKPCFEVWLALHFLEESEIHETSCKPLKPRIGKLKDSVSNNNEEFFEYLNSKFSVAFQRASNLGQDSSISTKMHLLVQKIVGDSATSEN